ncbi:MAG: MFS transporter [Lachnospiraceae bacterium]|nr:MFS transporter [Lachnospiraceae bacterium]
MATLLLTVIYMAFIGLGLPDSLFGAAWPAIYAEYGLPLSFGSFVTVLSFFGTTISSLCSARVINRFGTNYVTAFSTALTAVALLGMSFTGSYLPMCLCALPLGLGAGAIDTALNNYVALHYSATQMSFLHCFYGVGISVSPYILSLVLNGEAGWRGGYRIAVVIQAVIAVVLFCSVPLWKKVHGKESGGDEPEVKALPLKELVRIPGVKVMWLLFICSCTIECTCGSWGSTFLVEHKGLAAEKAAGMITFYYVGIAVGRFVSGVVATKLHSWAIIKIGQVVMGLALVVLCLPMGGAFAGTALFFVGLGNGPLFPNFNYLTPENFGEELSPSVIGTQMAISSIAIMTTPVLCSVLGQILGMGIFPFYLLVFFVLMVLTMCRARKVFAKTYRRIRIGEKSE